MCLYVLKSVSDKVKLNFRIWKYFTISPKKIFYRVVICSFSHDWNKNYWFVSATQGTSDHMFTLDRNRLS